VKILKKALQVGTKWAKTEVRQQLEARYLQVSHPAAKREKSLKSEGCSHLSNCIHHLRSFSSAELSALVLGVLNGGFYLEKILHHFFPCYILKGPQESTYYSYLGKAQ
jgi:hypothetical protein